MDYVYRKFHLNRVEKVRRKNISSREDEVVVQLKRWYSLRKTSSGLNSLILLKFIQPYFIRGINRVASAHYQLSHLRLTPVYCDVNIYALFRHGLRSLHQEVNINL